MLCRVFIITKEIHLLMNAINIRSYFFFIRKLYMNIYIYIYIYIKNIKMFKFTYKTTYLYKTVQQKVKIYLYYEKYKYGNVLLLS